MNKEDDLYFRIAEGDALNQVGEISEADFVRVPVDRYISLEEWSELMDRYEILRRQYEEACRSGEPLDNVGGVTVMSEEYHGYLNALRIIRDRSLQQIDKAKADEHGYTLKYADLRAYDRWQHPELKGCFITKTTPVSLNIDLGTATFLIEKDLREFYGMIDLPVFTLVDDSLFNIKKMTPYDLLIALNQKYDTSYSHDFYVENSDYGQQVKAFLDSIQGHFIFETVKISGNIGQGVYEVSYWATGFI